MLFRIPTLTRLTLNRTLDRVFNDLNRRGAGAVLDIGSKHAPYRALIDSTQYTTLDIDPANDPDICCDVHDIQSPPESFDTVIATEVIGHLRDPRKAIEEMHRVLRPGGVCIVSARFLYHYAPDARDYYRFTSDALTDLFADFENVTIHPHGTRMQVVWEMLSGSKKTLGLLSLLNPLMARIPTSPRTDIALGFVVWAEK